MKIHEAADIFPLDESTIPSLAEDIKSFGLLCPIELYKGKIIDGRRRLIACESIGVVPDTVDVDDSVDDPVAYVLSLNLHRRHLTASQGSMVAARARGFYDAKAKERMKAGGKEAGRGRPKSSNVKGQDQGPYPKANSSRQSRDEAAAAVGVSGRHVDRATNVLRDGVPELIQAVDAGKVSVRAAEQLAKEPKKTQRETVKEIEAGRSYTQSNGLDPIPGVSRGVGVARANEAIDCLKRIPKNDGLRKRGFQIVTDWIKLNK